MVTLLIINSNKMHLGRIPLMYHFDERHAMDGIALTTVLNTNNKKSRELHHFITTLNGLIPPLE